MDEGTGTVATSLRRRWGVVALGLVALWALSEVAGIDVGAVAGVVPGGPSTVAVLVVFVAGTVAGRALRQRT